MRVWQYVLIALSVSSAQAYAVESPTVAGPIGGSDIRSAMLPPPGVYVGSAFLGASSLRFNDKDGNVIPAFRDAHLSKVIGAPFIYYVPEQKVFGGAIAMGGYVPLISNCGHMFLGQANDCDRGVGDPYVEVAWSRFFGQVRPSSYPDANPILEGLTIAAVLGVVIPVGEYDASTFQKQVLSPGSNIWDVAPSVAFTYTTRPILAEGTEFSARLFYNHYYENPETRYLTGDIVNIDFAITEHIGPVQVGFVGVFATQIEDDRLFGQPAPPDGRQAQLVSLGGIVAYDLPALAASLKLKAATSAPLADNTVESWSVIFTWVKKL